MTIHSFFRKMVFSVAVLAGGLSSAWAVDVNTATSAELDGIKGIGPAISQRIIDARKSGQFKDWADFQARVKGIGPKVAQGLQAQGLTVGAGAKSAKAAPKMATKPAAPAVAAPAAPVAAVKTAPAAPAPAVAPAAAKPAAAVPAKQ